MTLIRNKKHITESWKPEIFTIIEKQVLHSFKLYNAVLLCPNYIIY